MFRKQVWYEDLTHPDGMCRTVPGSLSACRKRCLFPSCMPGRGVCFPFCMPGGGLFSHVPHAGERFIIGGEPRFKACSGKRSRNITRKEENGTGITVLETRTGITRDEDFAQNPTKTGLILAKLSQVAEGCTSGIVTGRREEVGCRVPVRDIG